MLDAPKDVTPPPASRFGGGLLLVSVVLTLAALKSAAVVVIPLFLAVFVAILVRPPIDFMSRFVPRWSALGVILVAMVGFFIGAWTFIVASAQAIAERAPDYYLNFRYMLESGVEWAAARGAPITTDNLGTDAVFNWIMKFVSASIAPIFSFLGSTLLVTVMLVLLLMESDLVRPKMDRAFGVKRAAQVAAPLSRVMSQFQRYFFTKTIISGVTGLCTGLFTWALGIDFAYIWGVLAFLLNFIPNVGSIIAVVPPTLIALVQFDALSYPTFTLVGLSAIQVTIGNFIDPRVMGRSLALSPFFVFAGMLFWGWMWGLAGVFLAVPLTVLLRMAFEQFEPLRPLAIMMSGVDRKAVNEARAAKAAQEAAEESATPAGAGVPASAVSPSA